jgi:hypothetical protein
LPSHSWRIAVSAAHSGLQAEFIGAFRNVLLSAVFGQKNCSVFNLFAEIEQSERD